MHDLSERTKVRESALEATALRSSSRGDLNSGSIARTAFTLAAPLLASNAGAVLFQLFDLTFLSRLGSDPMAAAIIVNQTIWQLLIMLTMGASFGTQSLVARAIGAGDTARASHTAGQALLMAAVVSLTVATCSLITPHLFAASGARAEFAPHGIPYLRLLLLLNAGLVGGMLARGVLIGAGDGRTPLLVAMVQFPLTLLLEWLLIFGNLGFPELGIRGAAVAIAIGQICALVIYVTVLFRGWSKVGVRLSDFRPDFRVIKEILRQSWPPALQMLGMVTTTFAILRIMRDFDPSIQAAYSIGLRLGMVVPLISFPLVNACATLVGQAVGANDAERAKATVRLMLKLHASLMWPALAILAIFRVELMSLLTADPAVIRAGATYLLFFSATFSLVALYFVILRSLQGAGDFLMPMAISLGCTLFITIPSAYVLSRTSLGPLGIWSSLLAHSIITLSATACWMSTGRWLEK